jgi:carboxyl-terminal processing protease
MKNMTIKQILISFTILFTLSNTAIADDHKTTQLERSLIKLFSIHDLVSKRYIDEFSGSELVERILKGSLSELDPHSSYLSKKDFDGMMESTTGKFTGVGMVVTKRGDNTEVVSPIDDTPAYKAGILPGDVVLKIDGTPLNGLALQKSVDLIRGVPGSKVKITVLRSGEVIDIDIVREIINLISVKSSVIDDIGYIRISSFAESTAELFDDALYELNELEIDSLVLDLRNNPGGLLSAAIKVLDAILPEDKLLVSTKGRNDTSEFYSKHPSLFDGNIVVLINNGSASASEIVSGAIKDYGRGVIIGKKSYGKGSVQSLIPLNDGSAIKLTTALYYTPGGTSLQATGVVPDISLANLVFSDKKEDKKFGEADLTGHIKNPNASKSGGVLVYNKISNSKLNKDPYFIQAKQILTVMAFSNKSL